jgi:hypothetical protein
MLRASQRWGLTRIEFAVVASITVIGLGLLLPALQQVRAGSGGTQCQNNLRQLALGAHNYHDTFRQFPPGMTDGQFPPGMSAQYVGALVHLLPFVEQDILYRNFRFDLPALYWQNPNNRPPTDGTDNVPPPPDGGKVYGCEWDANVFLCPEGPQTSETVTALLVARYGNAGMDYRDDDGLDNGHIYSGSPGRLIMARSHYLGMAGDWRTDPPYNGRYRGVFTYNSSTRFSDIIDGTSNTIMFGEAWGGFIDWGGLAGVPSGWSTGSRSMGFNYSTFGTCPNSTNPNCDLQSFGLSFGTFGALHFVHTPTGPALGFNVAMADGSVRTLRGDIDFGIWSAMSGIADGEIRPRGLEPDVCNVGVD